MPHIHIEYSANLAPFDAQPLLLALHQQCVAHSYVQHADELKSRAICQTDYLIGFADSAQAYLHAKVSLLSGRSLTLKQQIAQTVLQQLQQHCPVRENLNVQLCVEILEMDRECYLKAKIAN